VAWGVACRATAIIAKSAWATRTTHAGVGGTLATRNGAATHRELVGAGCAAWATMRSGVAIKAIAITAEARACAGVGGTTDAATLAVVFAAVTIIVVLVVAFFIEALHERIAANVVALTRGVAAVFGIEGVAVVAILKPGIDGTVAAVGRIIGAGAVAMAGQGPGVTVKRTIVAGFRWCRLGIYKAIATTRGDTTALGKDADLALAAILAAGCAINAELRCMKHPFGFVTAILGADVAIVDEGWRAAGAYQIHTQF